MISFLLDRWLDKKIKKEAELKEQAIEIIQRHSLSYHNWHHKLKYGQPQFNDKVYVAITQEENGYGCSLGWDYTKEVRSVTGGRIDNLYQHVRFYFHASPNDPIYKKIHKDYTALRNTEIKQNKDTLLNKLTELEKNLTIIDKEIDETKTIVDQKRKEILRFALNHNLPVDENVSVDEEKELEKLINKKNKMIDQKKSWLIQLHEL